MLRITAGRYRLTLLLLGSGAFAVLVAKPIQAYELELVARTTVDEAALTFATGPATRFSNTVNGRTHQQSPLTTYRGYQYVTYVNASRRICIGRRKLPSDSWEVIRFDDHRFESNDSHNTTVLGICDKDGTIHLAFDHHATRLNYRVSELGAAHHPDSVVWSADLFGPITHKLGSISPAPQVTYPRFFPAPDGNLMLYYRSVTSGNGNGMIERYDGDRHDWTPGLGRFIARDIGTYAAIGKTSQARCPYMNSLSFAGKRLHASWVWRDRFEKTDPRNQHDLCYAYSDDQGRTWRNTAGRVIGRSGEDCIHLDSPGLVVAPIPSGRGLANQNAQYAFADGSIHVVMRHRLDGAKASCYQHHWRDKKGAWRHEALSYAGDRPKLVGTHDGQLLLVYTDDEQLFIAVGQPNFRRSRWRWTSAKLPEPHSIYGDAALDLQRWEGDKVLSIYSQAVPVRDIRTARPEPVDGMPSSLNVVDYRLIESGASSE